MAFLGILNEDGSIENSKSIERLAEISVAYAKAGSFVFEITIVGDLYDSFYYALRLPRHRALRHDGWSHRSDQDDSAQMRSRKSSVCSQLQRQVRLGVLRTFPVYLSYNFRIGILVIMFWKCAPGTSSGMQLNRRQRSVTVDAINCRVAPLGLRFEQR